MFHRYKSQRSLNVFAYPRAGFWVAYLVGSVFCFWLGMRFGLRRAYSAGMGRFFRRAALLHRAAKAFRR